MKKILIITLGNSEIQFYENNLRDFELLKNNGRTDLIKEEIKFGVRQNRNYKDMYLPVSSRDAGKIILDNYELFKDIMKFPIVEPLIKDFQKQNIQIDKIIWVYTDQDDKIFKKTDTIFYAQILEKWIKENYNPDIIQEMIAVKKNVKDIDYQYKSFYERLNELLPENNEPENIYLFAQGGIDQINHALTLQLLQKYKDKVRILQKAENEDAKELEFPKLFLRDLTKQKVLKHIEDYDFIMAANTMLENNWMKDICTYAGERLNLNHELLSGFKTEDLPDDIASLINKYNPLLNTLQLKVQDYIYSYLFDIKNKRYNLAIQKLFSIYENLYRSIIDKIFEKNTMGFWKKEYDNKIDIENGEWVSFLYNQAGNDLIVYLKKKKVRINNPNTLTYFRIIKYYFSIKEPLINITEKEFNKFDGTFNRLRDIRNMITHKLDNITEKRYNSSFIRPDIDTFHEQLKTIAGINIKENSFFDIIKEKLLDKLR